MTTGITPNATNGTSRVVNGKTIKTDEIVNKAIEMANENGLDLVAAEASLKSKGWQAPSQAMIDMGFASETAEETIKKFAVQTTIINNIAKLSGASLNNQVGKWDFTNAGTIHKSFDNYLWRRVNGQRSRFAK